jgi:hypothetical protein
MPRISVCLSLPTDGGIRSVLVDIQLLSHGDTACWSGSITGQVGIR